MQVSSKYYKNIRAVVVGGANMTRPHDTDPKTLIGHINVTCAITMLREMQIRIIHMDTGGNNGRKLILGCAAGDFQVIVIPKPMAA